LRAARNVSSTPSAKQERLKARGKGGKSNVARFIGVVHLLEDTPDFPLNAAEDAKVLLGKVANYVLRGQVAATIGNCVAYLVATSIRAREASEFEEELGEPRKQLAEIKEATAMRQ
jgi:hypothetical protein